MKIKVIIAMACMMAILATASCQNTYIPYELGGDNYYTMDGSPDVSASISGTDEFERGDTVTFYVDLTNNGVIKGFKAAQPPKIPKNSLWPMPSCRKSIKKLLLWGSQPA